jgi:alkyl sulfatase BDS1-like metallo-beta-lactamase superfamily hydrolase
MLICQPSRDFYQHTMLDQGKPLRAVLKEHACHLTVNNFPHYLTGVEVALDNGKNLSFTQDHPNIPTTMTNHAKRMGQKIYKVANHVYSAVGYGLANIIFIVGDEGIVVVDTAESLPVAENARDDFFVAVPSAINKPIRAVVYTHNHSDHIAGVRAFASEQSIASGQCWIIAHETLMKAVENNASVVAPILRARSAYSFGALLEVGPEGQVNGGIGPTLVRGQSTFLAPTHTFGDRWEVTLAGVRFDFRHAPSETDDEVIAWLPDLKVLLSAEVIQGECLANVHTLRGTKYRDPQQWVRSIDAMRKQHQVSPVLFMVPAHGRPVGGSENIAELLTAYRDAIAFIHDQAVRFINQGATPEELVEILPSLPKHLAEHAWLGEYYGTVKHSARQVFSGQLGWFDGDPTTLDPLSKSDSAQRWITMAGGEEKVLAHASLAAASLDSDDLRWAAELSARLLNLNPHNEGAKAVKAQAFVALGYRTANINWRNWYLTAARELQGKYKALSLGPNTMTSTDILATLPHTLLFEALAVRVKAEACFTEHRWMHFKLPDNNAISLELRRGVLQIHERPNDIAIEPGPCLELAISTLTQVVSQGVAVMPALIANGSIKLSQGDPLDLIKFFSFFDSKATQLPELASR